jgi:hypothetical protein
MLGRLNTIAPALLVAAAALSPAAAADGPSAFYDSNLRCAVTVTEAGKEFSLTLNAAYTRGESPALTDITAIVTVGLDEYDMEDEHVRNATWQPQFRLAFVYPLSAGQQVEMEIVSKRAGGKRFDADYTVRVEGKTRNGRVACGLD